MMARMTARFVCCDPIGTLLWRLSATDEDAAQEEARALPMIPAGVILVVRSASEEEWQRASAPPPSWRGVFRYLKTSGEPEDWWARVEVRLGEWSDLSKAEYDERRIEPTFWALQEEESWREGAISLSGGG